MAPVEAAGMPKVAESRAAWVPFARSRRTEEDNSVLASPYCRVAKKIVTPAMTRIPRLA